MTNKNLSRELSCSFAKNGSPDCSAGSPPPCASYALCSLALCEICGIKPRYGVYKNFGDLDNNFQLVTNERKYRLIADTRYHYGVEDDDLRNLKPVYYPDFEQPTNFVKLLNVLHANGFHFRTYGFCKKQPITSCVLEHFVDKFRNRNDEEAEDFKQVIREQEWSYE